MADNNPGETSLTGRRREEPPTKKMSNPPKAPGREQWARSWASRFPFTRQLAGNQQHEHRSPDGPTPIKLQQIISERKRGTEESFCYGARHSSAPEASRVTLEYMWNAAEERLWVLNLEAGLPERARRVPDAPPRLYAASGGRLP
ncbi:hypothetical protein EYF80_055696 [Liparis tanakae]|uniref:Uncharacterized protein n=1 Tax=Liparis tanakae TaxID=230148 RepID=A0A4Z2F0X9_9TELE|nr:hypothetical protein EYF80_055696 [Liparis tanakae]